MGVIFCRNHTLKCCLTAIRKFVQFRSSTSIRVFFTSDMCWHGRSMWMDIQGQTIHCAAGMEFLQLTGKRSYLSPLCSLFISEPGPRRPSHLNINPGANKTKQKWLPGTRLAISYVWGFPLRTLKPKPCESQTAAKIKWQVFLVGQKCLAFPG